LGEQDRAQNHKQEERGLEEPEREEQFTSQDQQKFEEADD